MKSLSIVVACFALLPLPHNESNFSVNSVNNVLILCSILLQLASSPASSIAIFTLEHRFIAASLPKKKLAQVPKSQYLIFTGHLAHVYTRFPK
jgi:hypothetical protein